MVVDAEKYAGAVLATDNDPRITRVGRIIRPFRLDELPQLFNVLKGDMSIIGPRPEIPCYVEQFRDEIRKHFTCEVSDDTIDWCFKQFLLGIPVERLRALEQLKQHYRIYILSNTNAIMFESIIKEYFEHTCFIHNRKEEIRYVYSGNI